MRTMPAGSVVSEGSKLMNTDSMLRELKNASAPGIQETDVPMTMSMRRSSPKRRS